jgi:hypothetical protein
MSMGDSPMRIALVSSKSNIAKLGGSSIANKLTLAFMLGVCTGDSTHRCYHHSPIMKPVQVLLYDTFITKQHATTRPLPILQR